MKNQSCPLALFSCPGRTPTADASVYRQLSIQFSRRIFVTSELLRHLLLHLLPHFRNGVEWRKHQTEFPYLL